MAVLREELRWCVGKDHQDWPLLDAAAWPEWRRFLKTDRPACFKRRVVRRLKATHETWSEDAIVKVCHWGMMRSAQPLSSGTVRSVSCAGPVDVVLIRRLRPVCTFSRNTSGLLKTGATCMGRSVLLVERGFGRAADRLPTCEQPRNVLRRSSGGIVWPRRSSRDLAARRCASPSWKVTRRLLLSE